MVVIYRYPLILWALNQRGLLPQASTLSFLNSPAQHFIITEQYTNNGASNFIAKQNLFFTPSKVEANVMNMF